MTTNAIRVVNVVAVVVMWVGLWRDMLPLALVGAGTFIWCEVFTILSWRHRG